MAKEKKAHCCFVGCKADADVEIRHGKAPDAYTHSCTAHIGDLLTDEHRHTLTWLHPNPATGP
jgi:hypothetical protein